MASNKFRYPPAPNNGADTFSDNIVGLQTVDGGGLTQGNFEFTTYVVEKVNRTFDTGVFSDPISLSDLDIDSVAQGRLLIAKDYRVYPNYDISQVTNFSLYGSLRKRLSTSITRIINFFPAGIEVYSMGTDFLTGFTAYNISYSRPDNETTFTVDVTKFRNPFDIDYSINATRNISVRPFAQSPLRNMTVNYLKYALYFEDLETEYKFTDFDASTSLTSGTITVTVVGDPFSGATATTSSIILKPNNFVTEESFKDPFDEVEDFLLNRMVTPKYTATFKYPAQNDNGVYYTATDIITWPLNGFWNLDILTVKFDNYLERIDNVASNLDELKTDLISRFLTTGAFKEFDTPDQKVEKTLQIYGRAYDETKKFIDALAYITSVNYVPKNDIPSQLLQNLAQTLGWNTNISLVTDDDFLNSIFGTQNQSIYPGQTRDMTPNELNYQYYRNLILNSAYLFKSKGTRRSVEFILRLIGAPEALIEFNETIYVADGPINMRIFEQEFAQLTGGTFAVETPVLDSTNTFTIQGLPYTGFTVETFVNEVTGGTLNYPVDSFGYPSAPVNTEDYFFEKGAGWFEQTAQHRTPEQVDVTTSTFTGANPNVQTVLAPFTFGEQYFSKFETFPYMNVGFGLTRVLDNKKAWTDTQVGLRRSTVKGQQAYYNVSDERLVLNAKNIELNLNMGQGLEYDVWNMSVKYGYPIPNSGLTSPYPTPGDIDWTVINPKPKEKTFFEFAQTFYNNMINVRNRQTITDGKGGGYPTLQSLYWKYLNSQETVNIPSNQYTYQKMIDFTNGIGDYWMRLIEQVIPASTLWLGGQKMENSIFHRQKVVWRRQRGCEIVPVTCIACLFHGQLYGYDCVDQTVQTSLYPNVTFNQVLNQVINSTISTSGYTTNDCDMNSIVSTWFVDIRLDNSIVAQQSFYTGYGPSDVPTNAQWASAVSSVLPSLNIYGLGGSINGNTLVVSNIACYDDFTDKTLYLNVGVNVNIFCS